MREKGDGQVTQSTSLLKYLEEGSHPQDELDVDADDVVVGNGDEVVGEVEIVWLDGAEEDGGGGEKGEANRTEVDKRQGSIRARSGVNQLIGASNAIVEPGLTAASYQTKTPSVSPPTKRTSLQP